MEVITYKDKHSLVPGVYKCTSVWYLSVGKLPT